MVISISSDSKMGIALKICDMVRGHGHDVILNGALATADNPEWAHASVKTAKDVSEGRAHMGIVCCHTGTGATIAANKIKGIRAALCGDAYTASGARKWNDANVLGISLRLTSEMSMEEMLAAWFNTNEIDNAQIAAIDFINSQ